MAFGYYHTIFAKLMSSQSDKSAILISPGPVDGYPPVQHQARVLARNGYTVDLLTATLTPGVKDIEFSEPGVNVTFLQTKTANKLAVIERLFFYIRNISALRRRNGKNTIEICYDPSGVFYSDYSLFRPKFRIAHFHECMQNFHDKYFEARLEKHISKYELVVVPDSTRADILKTELPKIRKLKTVENYPMLAPDPSSFKSTNDNNRAEMSVVYCGSLGEQQKLNTIIESAQYWDENIRFYIIGNDEKPIGQKLHALVKTKGCEDKVTFLGWQNYAGLAEALTQYDLGIALLDSNFEQWRSALGASNKRYEYMRSGLAQIGDMNPGVPELLEGQNIGLCVKDHTAKEIARLINIYAKDRQRLESEGKKAYQLHKEKYNYEKAFQPVLDIIDSQLQ